MAIPEHFSDPDEYFEECLQFFDDYRYLYNFANTELMVKNVLDHIEVKNVEKLDIYKHDFDLELVDDEFLTKFFVKLKRLKPCHNEFVDDNNLAVSVTSLSPKKKHEIMYLAKEIKDLCDEVGCNTVVDFGSGLGYLGQQIFETTNLQVLGLECNDSHYVGAKKRQRKYQEISLNRVKYIKHTITQESDKNIQSFLDDKFTNFDGFCITGLHACADLTVDAINIFLGMEKAKSLVLMPCCYHKMASEGDKFRNFPLSACMRKYFEKRAGCEFLKVPFLRLGAQPPNLAEKLEDAVFNLLSRAVLEQYARQNNCRLKRNKRKAVNIKVMQNSFENYITNASSHGFTLIQNYSNEHSKKVEFNFDELRSLWRQIDEVTRKKAGMFVILQNNLQPVIENFILSDRLTYLRENGMENSRFKRIFNDFLSPRCLALVASK